MEYSDQNELHNKVINLHDNWKFKNIKTDTILDAQVPGTVHLDLMRNGIIPDPYYRDNLNKVQWVEDNDYEYFSTFNLDTEMYRKKEIILVFEGLDTHCNVTLNGHQILKANNQFRTWQVNVKRFLQQFNNQLNITFQSSVNYDREQIANHLPIEIPTSDDKGRMRKAAYQYGWDWGPRLVTLGIWKPIKLIGFDYVQIKNIAIQQKELLKEYCILEIEVDLFMATRSETYTIEVTDSKSTLYQKKDIKTFDKNHKEVIQIKINDPKLWWTHNLGESYLYTISVNIIKGQKFIDTAHKTIGLRTIELIQKKDEYGSTFKFRLNQVDVFMKGGNYIPPDMFMPRVQQQDYEQIIQNAIDSNYNMIRVWGGGNYESYDFYRLCDEKGILIWQDFMFANTMFPGDKQFQDNIREEVKEVILRLKEHPSIAVWVGNNEIQEGWNNWGWRSGDEKLDQQIWQWYEDIFQKIIPEQLEKLDPNRNYSPTSPIYGWGHQESYQIGDSHYWGVWAGMEDFETYNSHFGRFNSEYGIQGMPCMNSIKKFTIPEDWDINSAVMQLHERHPSRYENLLIYMKRYYKNFKDFVKLTYASQVMQSMGIKIAIESHRRNMPYSMGTLVWQLNDVWPVIESETLAKDVYIYIDDEDLKLSDNYFDVIPGIKYKIKVLNKEVKDIKTIVKTISLFDTYTD